MSIRKRENCVFGAIAVVALCSVLRTEAQPPAAPGAASIRLSGGALVPDAGIDRDLAASAPAALQTGPLHFIIQFEGRPSVRDRDVLASLGVQLLDPVPVNAYFAVAVPPTAQESLFSPGGPLDQPPYRAVVPLPAQNKLSPTLQASLRGRPVPRHAERPNGGVAVTIRFHSDVGAPERVSVLRDLGVALEGAEPQELEVGVEAQVPTADLLRVAAHDRIKSIDFIEQEGQNDNDTVRGADGADSDSVATAYDVSGLTVVIGQFEGGVPESHMDLSSSVTIADAMAATDQHATHVAGTMTGSGMVDSQWHGIAMGAKIRAYEGNHNRQAEYLDAISNHGLIASNHSWDTAHCHRLSTSEECYNAASQFYDRLISGRTETGAATGLPRRILFVGSAGNDGVPERYVDNDNGMPNGQYDPGEPIIEDVNDNGFYETSDLSRQIGNFPTATSPLSNFAMNERHDDHLPDQDWNPTGAYEMITLQPDDEVIYRDVDGSEDVSVGDVRLFPSSFGTVGSTVMAGDDDVNVYLRQFRMWGNIRMHSAKNTLTVGNYTAGLDTLARDSGRGPTPDGRLKPDLVAPGSEYGGDAGVTSTVASNTYASFGGTSQAAPVVTAVGAMLIEWYRTACQNADPKPSTLRAILLHSAVDLENIASLPGVFTGPDYAYGYGAVNAPNALAVMVHHKEGVATAADVGNPAAHTFEFTIGAVPDLKVTLAWDDPPWSAGTSRDPTTGLLHNDLDLELVSPSGRIYTPWRLDPSNPGQPAVASLGYLGVLVPADARDRRNTVEQVVVPNAAAGTWTIRVLASTLTHPDQDFSVVGDFLAPDEGTPCFPTPQADVAVQEGPAEVGAPSRANWLSLNVWNDNLEDPSLPNDDPVFNEVNNLYVRLRNRSNVAAKASSIDVWAAPASTAPTWPNDFAYAGRLPAPNVAAGESRVFGPLSWVPRRRSPSEQLSYYVRVTNPRDPIPPGLSGPEQSNNIALRNVHELDIREGTHFFSFELDGLSPIADGIEEVDLVISVTPTSRPLPIEAKLFLDPAVEERWIVASAPGNGTTRERGSQSLMLQSTVARLRLSVDPRNRAERLVRVAVSSVDEVSEPILVDVVQCGREGVTGGIRYVMHTGTPRPPRSVTPPAWLRRGDCSTVGMPLRPIL